MKWVKFNPRAVNLPKERRAVLVMIEGGKGDSLDLPELKNPVRLQCHLPPMVCVGYLRRWSNRNNFFVTPGAERKDRKITHWCDCLGDDFNAPLWDWRQPDTK